MTADVATFRDTFEEFGIDRASDDLVQRFLDLAMPIYRRTELGTIYLAAHFLKLFLDDKDNPGAGALASEGLGPHSESYRESSPDKHSPVYDRTEYGRQFLLLKRPRLLSGSAM